MKAQYEQLYEEMIAEIKDSQQMEMPETEIAASCFWIAKNYWDKLKEIIKDKTFKDDSEEVDFFRNVKPHFTCYIEYYVILSEALQSVPAISSPMLIVMNFWNEENKRFARFCIKNDIFVTYYERGDRYRDINYFIRANVKPGTSVTTPPYDIDITLCTSQDRTLRSYLAHKMYNEYVKGKIRSLCYSG